MKNLILISQLAYSIIAPILLGLYIGLLIDKWTKMQIFSLILMLLGIVSGFINAYKLIIRLNREEK